MQVLKNIPTEIDYDQFKWLRKGDILKIAEKVKLNESTVRASLKKRSMNIDILVAAMQQVIENKKKLMELQCEAKTLSHLLQLKVA
jgi:hypothetical protein